MAQQIAVIANGEGFDFWQIGDEVYRAQENQSLDVWGQPQSKRWECTIEHWTRFRSVYNWAADVEVSR